MPLNDPIVVLGDGETFTEVRGCLIVDIPPGTVKSHETATEDVDEFLREGDFHAIDIPDLLITIQDLLNSEDNTGCSDDLTVVSSGPVQKLKEMFNC